MCSVFEEQSTKALRVALGATLAALAAVALVAVSPAARAADGTCQRSGSEVVCTFDTPGTSTWTVPDGVTQDGGLEGSLTRLLHKNPALHRTEYRTTSENATSTHSGE
jgi:hypothetical protein